MGGNGKQGHSAFGGVISFVTNTEAYLEFGGKKIATQPLRFNSEICPICCDATLEKDGMFDRYACSLCGMECTGEWWRWAHQPENEAWIAKAFMDAKTTMRQIGRLNAQLTEGK